MILLGRMTLGERYLWQRWDNESPGPPGQFKEPRPNTPFPMQDTIYYSNISSPRSLLQLAIANAHVRYFPYVTKRCMKTATFYHPPQNWYRTQCICEISIYQKLEFVVEKLNFLVWMCIIFLNYGSTISFIIHFFR